MLNNLLRASRPFSFINVTVLTAAGIVGRSLRVEGGCVAEIDGPPRPGDRRIDGQGGLLIPGLINAHDHLELNTFQRLRYRPRYRHALHWIEDIEARFDSDPALTTPRRQPLADRLLVGGLKNLCSGATTVCHHNPLYRSLRRDFVVRVVDNYTFNHSLFRESPVTPPASKTDTPWLIHLAEGVDETARQEFEQLRRLDRVQPNSVLIHGVGLTDQQRWSLIQQMAGLVWCPGSNLFMLGQTAPVQAVAAAGKVALGSDSRLSGEADLLAELRVAHQTGQLTPRQLFAALTVNPARMLRLTADGRGDLRPGGVADLLLLPPPATTDPFAALLPLARPHLRLVMIGGQPLLAEPTLRPVFEAAGESPVSVRLDGCPKLMARRLARRIARSAVGEPGLEVK